MTTKFWVGGGSANTWAATGNTNWAHASGGAGNQTVPGVGDICVFDGGSGTGNSVIGANITVQGLECDGSTLGTGAYAGTITHNTSVTLTINTGAANSFRLATGMTYTPASGTSLVTLTHTTGTANIKSYGKALGALTINGAGGTTQILDALLVNAAGGSTLTVTSGIFDANNGAGGPYAITAVNIVSSGALTRSLILGGTVTIGGNNPNNTGIWNMVSGGLTFTKNSANIIILAPTAPPVTMTFTGAGFTYNDLTLNAATGGANLTIGGANTFAHLAINSGWGVNFTTNLTTTIQNAFAWSGTQAAPILIINTNGSSAAATLSVPSGACTLNWGGIGGVNGTGGATFTATNTNSFPSAAGTFNTGWSISPPADATITPPAGSIAALARGTVTTGASTTSVPTSALTFQNVAASGVVSNQLAGRAILFDGATTTAGLRGAASTISASSTSNTPTFTVATLPATPASGDLFTII